MIERKGRKSPLVPFFFLAHVPFFSTCSFPVPTTISSFCYQEKWKGKVSTGEQLLLSVPTCKACNAACMLYSLSPSLVRCPRTALGPLLVPRAWPTGIHCVVVHLYRQHLWFAFALAHKTLAAVLAKRLVPLPLYMPYHPDLLHQHLFLENKGPIHTIQAHRSRKSYTSFER